MNNNKCCEECMVFVAKDLAYLPEFSCDKTCKCHSPSQPNEQWSEFEKLTSYFKLTPNQISTLKFLLEKSVASARSQERASLKEKTKKMMTEAFKQRNKAMTSEYKIEMHGYEKALFDLLDYLNTEQ